VTALDFLTRFYWWLWAVTSGAFFLAPEIWALASGHPEATLSAWIWRMEDFLPDQQIWHWNAFHLLFIAMLLVLDVWLLGHFGWGLWR
jgi:hypothetical protein